jgi:carboxypeptidase D
MLLWSSLLLLLSLLTRVASIRRLPSDRRVAVNNTDTLRRLKAAKSVKVPTPSSREDHRVTSLPYLANNTFSSPHYAGLLPANADKTKYLFYWLFEADGPTVQNGGAEAIPLVLWLNGGPGCSSMDGLFLEHGPFKIVLTTAKNKDKDKWEIHTNPHSWHTAPAHVVYLDQPVGTGLSFTTSNQYPSNDEQVNQDFYYWLQQFLYLHAPLFLNHDKTALKTPLFFTGESHAGHYIPSMMNYIHQHNQGNNDNNLKIRVEGAAIGNGWVDPYHQYAGAEAAFGHGLIDLAQKYALDEEERACQQQLASGNFHYGPCFSLLDDIVAQSQGQHGSLKISQYDATTWELKSNKRTFPLGHERVESYLGGWPTPNNDPKMSNNIKDAVLEAIHATYSQDAGQRYQECTDPPYNALAHQDGLGVVNDVVALLEDNVRLLFFNGMNDLICNHVGTEVMLLNLPHYSKRNDYLDAQRYSWSFQSKVVGYIKEYENLSYLKVLNSGHMVPMDLPEVALEMMRNFLFHKSFQSSPQVLDNADKDESDECPICPTCNTTTKNDDDDANPASGLASIVAHSWIGAMVAVVLFLGVFLFMRKQRQGTTTTMLGGTNISYGNLEMKEGGTYRDEPVYRDNDDDDDDNSETNRNGII